MLVALASSLALPTLAPHAASATGPSTSGTEFWIAFPANHRTSDGLELFVASDVATTGTVTGAPLAAPISFSVTAGTVTTVPIPVSAASSVTGVQNIGLTVTTADAVSLYGINRLTGSSDAFTAIPVTGLGTRYRLAAATSTYSTSIYAIVATADGTTVTIEGGAAIALDAGEAYVATVSGDASGMLVESSEPVSVLSGHRCSNFKGVNCDHMVEHLPPTDDFGTRFAVVRFANEDTNADRTKDAFKIIADRDGTAVNVDGVLAGTINAGQSLIVEPYGLDGSSTLNGGEITTSEPALVVQYMSTGRYRVDVSTTTVGDPSMTIVPPIDQFRNDYLFATMAAGFTFDAVNLVVPTAAVESVRLDGSLVGSGSFRQLGTSTYSAAQLRIASGTHTLTADAPFGAIVYGANPSDSYALPGGVGASAVTTPAASPAAPSGSVGPALDCDAVIDTEGTVACRITGGDANIDILWRLRAADGTIVREGPVTLDDDGRGIVQVTLLDTRPGRYSLELVEWGAEDSFEVPSLTPTSVPAGGGSDPSVVALAVMIAAALIIRSRAATVMTRWSVPR